MTQPSLDGQTTLELELSVEPNAATLAVAGPAISIRALNGGRSDLRFA